MHDLNNEVDVINLDCESNCKIDLRRNVESVIECGPTTQKDLSARLVHKEELEDSVVEPSWGHSRR